jgi:hypothetical protein
MEVARVKERRLHLVAIAAQADHNVRESGTFGVKIIVSEENTWGAPLLKPDYNFERNVFAAVLGGKPRDHA